MAEISETGGLLSERSMHEVLAMRKNQHGMPSRRRVRISLPDGLTAATTIDEAASAAESASI
jgi:hypothetical protein